MYGRLMESKELSKETSLRIFLLSSILTCRLVEKHFITQYGPIRLLTGYLKFIRYTLPILFRWATDWYATIFHFVHSTTNLTLIGIQIYP